MAGDHLVSPPWRVVSQLNIFIPVEMTVILVGD